VSGVRVKAGEAGVLNNPVDVLITPTGRVLVSSANDDRVVEFDVGGTYVGDFIAAGAGGLDFPTGMVLAPSGTLLVASADTNSVLEYDGTSGAPLGVVVAPEAGGLIAPLAIAFGPNGNLFATSADDRVIEYDGTTGEPVGDFVTAGDNGGLSSPHDLLFKPDGNLLVTSFLTDQILEYDGATGAFIGQFNHNGTETVLTLDAPWGLRLGPDGYVYASRYDVSTDDDGGGHHDDQLHINSTRIYVFDPDSGNFVRSYVTGHDTGLSYPRAFDFFPGQAVDCNFNMISDSCDIASGYSSDDNGNGTPDECEDGTCPADLDGDGSVATADLLALLGAWGKNPGHPADLDGDGSVSTSDLLEMLGSWGPCV
jgi:WD40 repeat protein